MRSIDKYLRVYAEKEVALLETFPCQFSFKYCVAIPACDEDHAFVERLRCSKLANNALLILVVNQAPKSDPCVAEANQKLFDQVQQKAKNHWQTEHLILLQSGDLFILLVNRFSEGKEIPLKEGVGRARKLACDLAVSLFSYGVLKSNLIYSTDADAHLPDNYFSHSNENLGDTAAALVFDFVHIGDEGEVLTATRQYEQAIKYYRQALALAGSPYAFYTLGSTLAVNIEAYAKVRGFPARSGGEDFYLLNKLAKVGDIVFTEDILIRIEARLSSRVPFGTGPAVTSILSQNKAGSTWHYYHPQIFQELKTLLQNQQAIWQHIDTNAKLDDALGSNIVNALTHIGIEEFFSHCRKQNLKYKARTYQFMVWFDAFKTLKFVHFMQEHYYAAIPLSECLQKIKRNKI